MFTRKQGNSAAQPGRLLWMTDTYGDHNGVSTVLESVHEEIKRRDLPVDLLVCSHTVSPDDHLVVLKPVSEFTLPLYRQQPFRIPNFVSVQRVFRRGGYDRIICSTEGPMGFAALWLRKKYSVEAYFFMHTDWMEFAREALSVEAAGLNRLQHMLRLYYRRFGHVFVLNSDHRDWLTGRSMRFDPSRVFLTAHWAGKAFSEPAVEREPWASSAGGQPVVLYAGRLSREKGVMILPAVIGRIRKVFPEVRVVIAGSGPAEADLKEALPGATYTGWVDREALPDLYRTGDILLMPSRFDTFSCVVLEALSCGLPVAAFNTKGPKDILEDGVSGYLVENEEEMAARVTGYLLDPGKQAAMKRAAIKRAEEYRPEVIMDRLLADVGLVPESCAP